MSAPEHSNMGSRSDHLAGAGGVVAVVDDAREPYAALDDLMSVVEIFCPDWPSRSAFPADVTFLL